MSMITMTPTAAAAHGVSRWSALVDFFAEFCAGAREGREIEARYDALSRKSDAELAAIGLTRYELARAALTGRC